MPQKLAYDYAHITGLWFRIPDQVVNLTRRFRFWAQTYAYSCENLRIDFHTHATRNLGVALPDFGLFTVGNKCLCVYTLTACASAVVWCACTCELDRFALSKHLHCFMKTHPFMGGGLPEIENAFTHFVTSGVGAPTPFCRRIGEGEKIPKGKHWKREVF